jgi:hypothetical protein
MSPFGPAADFCAIARIIIDTTEAKHDVDAQGSSWTPESPMDCERAAMAPSPVSQPSVEIAGMPM